MDTIRKDLDDLIQVMHSELNARQLLLKGNVPPTSETVAPKGVQYKDLVTNIRYENNGTIDVPVWDIVNNGGPIGGRCILSYTWDTTGCKLATVTLEEVDGSSNTYTCVWDENEDLDELVLVV